jgi:hypothetical protein
MVFTFQYYNGYSWVDIANAVIDQIIDELNGQLELDFIIPNTSANMTFVQSNQQVQLLWGSSYGSGSVIFSGLLMAYTATFTQIKCTVYNDTFEIMQKRQVTGAFNNVAASTVLAAICTACGMTAGSCPSTVVSIQFNSTDCLTAATSLASLLNENVYNSGSTVIIGQKGNQTPTSIYVDSQSSVNFDRSKTAIAGVIIRGVSPTGQTIIGTAGSVGAGNNTITLTNNAVTSQSSLNALASAYLESLAETNSGCPLEADINQTAGLNSGDLVTISNGAELGLSGNYAIYRITKNLTKSTVEIVIPAGAFLALINETSSINGVIGNLASSTAALQTLSPGSDSNVQQDAYLTLTDNLGDVATLTLGCQAAPSYVTMNPSGADLVYVIPAVSNQAGSAVTFKDPYMSVGVPAFGLGTYVNPFLWVDSVLVFTDVLQVLHASAIALDSPLKFYSVAGSGVKLYDATNSAGSSGQFLTVNGSGLPVWTTYTPAAWNGGTVTNAITAPSYTVSAGSLTTLINFGVQTPGLATPMHWLLGSVAYSNDWQMDLACIYDSNNVDQYLIFNAQLTGGTRALPLFSAQIGGFAIRDSIVGALGTRELDIIYIPAMTNGAGTTVFTFDYLGDLTLAGNLTVNGTGTSEIEGALNVMGAVTFQNTSAEYPFSVYGQAYFNETVNFASEITFYPGSGAYAYFIWTGPYVLALLANSNAGVGSYQWPSGTGPTYYWGVLDVGAVYLNHLNELNGGDGILVGGTLYSNNTTNSSIGYCSYYGGGGGGNSGGICLDAYGNVCFVGGGSSNTWNVYTAASGGKSLFSVSYSGGIVMNPTSGLVCTTNNAYCGSTSAPWAGVAANYMWIMNIQQVTSAHTLCISSSGEIGYPSSSSIRYKENIRELTDCSWIYALKPKMFDYKIGDKLKDQVGLTAEEVVRVNPQLVYCKNGQPESVYYENLTVPMLVEMKNQKKRIEQIEQEINVLQLQFKALKGGD